MKNFAKYIFLIMGSSMLLPSCNDFLDREPLDSVTPADFFKNEGDLAAYAVKHYNFNTHNGWGLGTWAADNATDNQAATDYDNKWIPGEWKTSETYNDEPWNFTAIRECNYFFEQVLPKEKEISGNNVSHYIGEMYFLRAKNYFDKVQIFGDFPIVKTTLPDEMEPLVQASKREPSYKVVDFILEDLDNAINRLSTTPPDGKNRISRYAAYLLKSRVALYEASWLEYHKGTAMVPGGPGWPGKAEDIEGFDIDKKIEEYLSITKAAALEVIKGVPLVENNAVECQDELVKTDKPEYKMGNPYFAQFSANSLEGYSEIILWRSYNMLEWNIMHSAPFYIRVGGNSGFTRQFVETFLCRNGKPIYASDGEYKGDKTLLDVRKNRDLRLQLFMMTPGELLSEKDLTVGGKVVRDTLANAPSILEIKEKRCVTGYQLRKGLSDNWYRDGNTAIEGSHVYRAAEAYLNYIEADCMEHDGTSISNEAAGYWGKLRKRAGLPEDYQVTVDATDLEKEALNDWAVYSAGKKVSSLLYNIRRERRCELIEEGFRMNDLRRWRALDQVKNFRIEGVNLWESELKDMYPEKDENGEPKPGTTLLVQEGAPEGEPNVSSYQNSGKYLNPYRIAKKNNLMYDKGYTWCEAHYLTPICIKHFRITSSNPNDLSTSVLYQNPGWPTEANQGPIGY